MYLSSRKRYYSKQGNTVVPSGPRPNRQADRPTHVGRHSHLSRNPGQRKPGPVNDREYTTTTSHLRYSSTVPITAAETGRRSHRRKNQRKSTAGQTPPDSPPSSRRAVRTSKVQPVSGSLVENTPGYLRRSSLYGIACR